MFCEMFVNLVEIPFKNTSIDWMHGDTATSGLLNLFCFDEAANAFDKTGKLVGVSVQQMDVMFANVIKNVASAKGSTNATELETSLCAYRKFYKGSRYNGYYLDRMLEEIYAMQESFPKESEELLKIRERCFEKKHLGEIGGWRGIRPQLKKMYIESGAIL